MELDIWIPSLSLAFEYQGEQHYHDLGAIFGRSGSLSLYQERDVQKRITCENTGNCSITIF